MAITTRDTRTGTIETTHAGAVIRHYTREVRAMSDVYCDATFALIWDVEKREAREISVVYHFECDSRVIVSIEDDAPDGVREFLAQRNARINVHDWIRARRAAELDAHNYIRNGMSVRSTYKRGKNKGVEGVVFWMRDGRAGVRTSDRKDGKNWADVAWVDAGRLENAVPCEYKTAEFSAEIFAVASDYAATRGEGMDPHAIAGYYRKLATTGAL